MSEYSGKRLDRLYRSAQWSHMQMKPFREARRDAVKQYCGNRYFEDGSEKNVPLNLIEVYVSVITRHLAARTPRTMVSTPYLVLKAAAGQLEMAIDHLLEEIRFGETMRTAVVDAIFGIGVIKTGLREAGTWQEEGLNYDIGQPFADAVDLDDFIVDMNQKRWDKIAYIGHRFSMPVDEAKEFQGFDKTVRETITSREKPLTTEGEERIEEISRSGGEIEELEERAEFFEIWVPKDNLIVVCRAEDLLYGNQSSKPLAVRDWTGPEKGPYDVLCFNRVPGQLLPKPPIAGLIDLHLSVNNALRKLHEQARNQKEITTYTPGNAEDASRIIGASHGDSVQVKDTNAIQQVVYNGISPSLLAFLQQMKAEFSWAGGNIDTVGGLSAQADTFGQERLLSESSSKLIASMQDDTVEFAANVIGQKLAWYLWYDPLISIPMVKRVEGVDVEMPFVFDSDAKEGDFLQYNVRIQPYSMSHQSPTDKLNALQAIFAQFLAPFADQMAQQGVAINFPGLLRKFSKYMDFQDLDDIVMFTGENEQLPSPVQTGSRKPAGTTRQYDRVVRPGGQRQQTAQMIQSLMAAEPQRPQQPGAA